MIHKPDYVRKKFAPFLDKTLKSALAHRIETEFPRIGGPRMTDLCAQMILEVLADHIHPRESISGGQALWLAISVDDPPSRGKRTRNTKLVPVVLDLITPDDIEAILARESRQAQIESRCVRICKQAFDQHGLLSGCDLSLLVGSSESTVAHALTSYEKRTQTVVPRRATIHDVGTGMTHKRVICLKRHLDGQSSHEIARETFHSIDAVDRYLGDYDRVRHSRKHGLSTAETSFTLKMSNGLVQQYIAIDDEIDQARRV